MNRIAIVIGSTGLVGRQLVPLLLASDKVTKVVTLSRRPDCYESAKLSNHVIEFDRLAEHASLFDGDLLFSCLGTTIKQAGSIQAQRRVDLDYQFEAARLAADQGVSHYLLVSSSGANASSANPYMKMKGELEEKISGLSFERVSIFQPSLLLGERPQLRMAEKFGSMLLPAICKLPGLQRYRPIQGQEVAEKMLQTALSQSEAYQRYTLEEVFPT